MLRSVVRSSYRSLSQRRRGALYRAVLGSPVETHRIPTSLLSSGVQESTVDRPDGDRGDIGEGEKPRTNWKIDPFTGKKRVGNNWNYHAELSALAHRTGVDSLHLPSLQVALRDKSVVGGAQNSEGRLPQEHSRLSFLGYSVLLHYVHEYLYFNYPKLQGSMLDDIGSFLTSEAVLTDLSSHLGVTQLIQTKKLLSDPVNSRVVTNAFCAVIGVLYEKQGGKAARSFVHDFVISQLASKDLDEVIKLQHPRFMLHAILKGKGRPRLVTRLIKESGRATHFPSFVVGVFSGEQLLGEGCGTSLKRAEREAMTTALQTHFRRELANAPLPSDHEDFLPDEELHLKLKSEELTEDTASVQ